MSGWAESQDIERPLDALPSGILVSCRRLDLTKNERGLSAQKFRKSRDYAISQLSFFRHPFWVEVFVYFPRFFCAGRDVSFPRAPSSTISQRDRSSPVAGYESDSSLRLFHKLGTAVSSLFSRSSSSVH